MRVELKYVPTMSSLTSFFKSERTERRKRVGDEETKGKERQSRRRTHGSVDVGRSVEVGDVLREETDDTDEL